MKLVRYGDKGSEKPGIIDEQGTLRDLSAKITDITPETVRPKGLAALKSIDVSSLPEVLGDHRFGVPVSGIPKIVAIGQND